MKRFFSFFIALLFAFFADPAFAFDPSGGAVFEPPMIYSVYEEEGGNVIPGENVILNSQNVILNSQNVILNSQNVILSEHQVIPSEVEESLLDPEQETQEVAQELSTSPLNWLFYLEKLQKYAKNYIDDIIYKATWELPDDPGVVTEEYLEGLEDWQRNKVNYERNIYQSDIPLRVEDLNPDEWECYGEAVAHNLAGASGNIDYRGIGKRAGQQAIYDGNGDLVTTPENMGTFDYFPPLTKIKAVKHCDTDVGLWIELGNSPKDSTTKEERIVVMNEDKITRLCLYRLGYIPLYGIAIKTNPFK